MTSATPEIRRLAEIGAELGSDKLSHRYLQFYENLFATIRHEPVRLLELGVGSWEHPDDSGYGSHSLRMWREYFPQGQIVGLDILDKSAVADDRISIARGSQTDETLLRELVSAYGPFDIVIDGVATSPTTYGRASPSSSLSSPTTGSTASKTSRRPTGPSGADASDPGRTAPPWRSSRRAWTA